MVIIVMILGGFVFFSLSEKNLLDQKYSKANASLYPEDSLHDSTPANNFSIVKEDTIVIDQAFLELYENAIVITPEFEEAQRSSIPGTQAKNLQKPKYKKQFIALSFDGSYTLNRWRSLLNFSDEQKALGKDIRFTFFTSGVYFLADKDKAQYKGPGRSAGRSDIGFGGTKNEVLERVAYVKEAHSKGHEIASHANGHFDGSGWSFEEWMSELNQFEDFISIADIPEVKGFRAPLLEVNKFTYQALAKKEHTYDASGVARQTTSPWKDEYNIWHFPLVTIKVGGKNSLSMDYNHYVGQTGAKSIAKRGTDLWNRLYLEVYNAYIDYFNRVYYGPKTPMNIGHHFSWWNDGVYHDALLDFAETVCGKEDVICGTYSELVEMLENGTI